MVTCFDVCEILEMLSEASVKVFLDGGWGVYALIGRETRTHNDIDLFVEKKDYCITISVITGKGYREVIMDYTTDSHTVWKDDNGRIIDMHCFEYVEDGTVPVPPGLCMLPQYSRYFLYLRKFRLEKCIRHIGFHLLHIRNNAYRLFFRCHLSRQYGCRSYSPL